MFNVTPQIIFERDMCTITSNLVNTAKGVSLTIMLAIAQKRSLA